MNATRQKIRPFKTVSFWAREYRSPLFWYTYKNGGSYRDKTLVFRKGSVMHLYHLDDRVERGADAGRAFFIEGDGLAEFRSMADKVSQAIDGTLAERSKTDMRTMSSAELSRFYSDTMGIMHSYLEVYVMTAEHVLSDIDEREYADLLSELGEIRFRIRKEGEGMFMLLLGQLVKELARRAGLKMTDLLCYTHDEVVALLDQGESVSEDEMEARKKGYAVVTVDGKQELLTGRRFKELYQDIVPAKRGEELHGRVAMSGCVSGVVRIIRHDRRDISGRVTEFQEGEILVTEMTRPDTVMACRKAAAIVTDEGGVACHAAIISRELGIPCIVGTKSATQVLKDGDSVEVDAETGMVRII